MGHGKREKWKIAGAVLAIILLSSIILAYSQYLTLKKAFVSKISDKASLFIGQEVRIGDFSFSPSAGINIHDVVIENPEGFDKGQLLRIKKVTFHTRFTELSKGMLSFRTIEIEKPELTLIRDKNKRFNISDKFLSFLSKKVTIKYRIDILKIRSGTFDINRDSRFHVGDVSATLHPLSSDSGTKTLIETSASLLGNNKMSSEGWFYLNSDPGRFELSVSLKDIELQRLVELLGKGKIDTERAKVDISLHAEGDTKKGVALKSGIHLKKEKLWFLHPGKKLRDITLDTDAFLDIGDGSLIIKGAVLSAGDVSTARLAGVIKDLFRNPSYNAHLNVNVPDLSAFDFVKGLRAGGVMTSDDIGIKGTFDEMPAVSGSLRLDKAFLEFKKARVESIDANIVFSVKKEMSAKAKASAKILKAGEYIFDAPADLKLMVDARGKPESMVLISSLKLSPFRVSLKEGKNLRLENLHVLLDGSLKRRTFSGKSSMEFEGIEYADYIIQRCTGRFAVDYTGNAVSLGNPEIKSEKFDLSASVIKIVGRKDGLVIESKGMSGSYPDRKIVIREMDGSINLNFGEALSGEITASAGEIIVHDVNWGAISGNGKFDKDAFSVDVPKAEIFKGIVRLSAAGKTSDGPFPLSVALTAENMDLRALSRALSGFVEIPYHFSGEANNAAFKGTIESFDSINGRASVRTRNLSVAKAKEGKTIVKDIVLNSGAVFRGKDLDFEARAATGNLSAEISGTVSGFAEHDRAIKIKAVLPETKITDTRNSLWDIFPDSLLYAGLDGSFSADISIGYNAKGLKAEGDIIIKNLKLEGENGEYSLGPVNGKIPVRYNNTDKGGEPLSLPSFERSEFQDLSEYYTKKRPGEGYRKITIGSLSYGFRLLEDIEIWIDQRGRYLNIDLFGANIFGGRLNGSAVVDLSEGNYRAGMLVKQISLTRLCEDITPIKGYISGKVDGIAVLKGTGAGMSELIGRSDFWTYSAGSEKTVISREFLEKMGGPSMKAYLRERPFDKGIISLYLQKGFLIFKELDISHKNILGMTDLSVKVAPFHNRIEIDHLLSTIAEAAERARER